MSDLGPQRFKGSRFRGSGFSPAAGLKSGKFNRKRNFGDEVSHKGLINK
jgi:hypothetical protein